MLDIPSKKSLRSASQYFLALSKRFEKYFMKKWILKKIKAERLKLFADQVDTVRGIIGWS